MLDETEATGQFAEINGTSILYDVAGEGHPLVLMHAGICDSRMWDDQWEELARHFKVIRYDVRGFGRSAIPSQPFAHRDDLFALLELLNVKQASLLAASMAGRIAIELTLEHPDMVDALILVGSGVGAVEPSAELIAGWEKVDVAYNAGDIAQANEIELGMWVDGPGRSPQDVDPAIRERVRVMNANNFAMINEAAEENDLEPPARERLHELRIPVLVIAGDHDQPHVLGSARHFEQNIPNTRTVIMAGTAHLPSMEQPAEFNRLIVDFLRNNT